MFGTNPVRHVGDYTPDLLRVQSVFLTIQGEGPLAGVPAVFIRLAGCNLRCAFCDTDFETGWSNVMKVEALVENVIRIAKGAKLVVITGGEPLLQDLMTLVRMLTSWQFHVQIETSGTLSNKTNELLVGQWAGPAMMSTASLSIVVSPKTPKIHPVVWNNAAAFKYVVSTDHDLLDNGLPAHLAQPPKHVPVFIQPMDVQDRRVDGVVQYGAKEKNLTLAIDLCLTHGYRLSIQQHKVIGVE